MISAEKSVIIYYSSGCYSVQREPFRRKANMASLLRAWLTIRALYKARSEE